MRREAKIAGAGPLADFTVGQRVMTVEGYPGTVDDIHEGPADLTTIFVTLDNDMGGGEYAEAELTPLADGRASTAAQRAAIVEAGVTHTAVDDYPELGTILSDRLPPTIQQRIASKTAGAAWTHADDEAYDDDLATGGSATWICTGCGQAYDPRHPEGEHHDHWTSYDGTGAHTAAMIPAIDDHLIPAQFAQYPQHPMGGDGIAYFRGDVGGGDHVDCLLYYLDDALVGVLNHFPKDMGPERAGNVLVMVHPDHRRQGIAKALWGEAKRRWHVTGAQQDTTPNGAAFLRSLGEPASTSGWTIRAVEHLAFYLPPVPQSEQRASTTDLTPGQKAGYDEGYADGQQGVTRDPSQPEDPDFMAGYDMGWAEGVTVAREPANSWDIEDLGKDQVADVPASLPSAFGPMQASLDTVDLGMPMSRDMAVEAGAWGDAKAWIEDNSQPGTRYTYDWCRFRRNSHCYLPSGLNEEASRRAGYAVWVPMDRGYCWRSAWETQQKCSTGMPGPKADGFTDATVAWEDGGQRNGTPDPSWTGYADTYGPASRPGGVMASKTPDASAALGALVALTASLVAEGAFEVTASWADVRKKAKRIRESGGVRIAAARDNVVVGHIKGDTGVYETEIVSFPGKRNAATWSCGCKWSSYSWGRSGPWKKYEGRMCSHALALQYEAQSRGMNGKTITPDSDQPAWMSDGAKGYTPARQLAASLHMASPLDDAMKSRLRSATTLEQAAEIMLTLARREEPKVYSDLTTLVAQNHGEMVGLDFRFKSSGSLLRKMKAEATLFRNPGECAMNMSDTLRFTALFPPENYTRDTTDVLNALRARGYKTRVKNYWGRGDAYNGVNVALTTPSGHPVELQFHTEQSFRIKEEVVHPVYEKWRTESDPNRKAILAHQMRDEFDMAHRPAGALGIEGRKKQPILPYNQIDWFGRNKAASLMTEGLVDAAAFRYLALTNIDGDPETPDEVYAVLRTDGAFVEVWEDGQWLEDSDFGRYVFLGDPTSEEIDADEAAECIAALSRGRTGARREASEQVDDESPLHGLTAAALGLGATYAEVRQMLLSAGVAEPAKVVAAARKTAKDENVAPSEHGDPRLQGAGVSVKKDDDGYYVTTHRARSKSYESVAKIPDSEIERIEATGSRHPFSREAMPVGPPPSGVRYLVTSNRPGDPQSSYVMLGAFLGEEMIGYMTWGLRKDWVQSVWVKPEYRRRRIAETMFERGKEFEPSLDHHPDRTDDGDAWAKAVTPGVTEREHNTSEYQYANETPSSVNMLLQRFDTSNPRNVVWDVTHGITRESAQHTAKSAPPVLYHYTSEIHLPAILSSGHLRLTDSNIEISGAGPRVVWLTTTLDGNGNGLDGGFGKGSVRLTIDASGLPVHHWPTWSFEQGIEGYWYDALDKAGGGGSENWWVCTREIPLDRVLTIEVDGVPYKDWGTGRHASLGGDDPCTACSGTGEQRNGHECYLCGATGQGSEERRNRERGMTNANPENGLEVGQDDSINEPGSKVHEGMGHLGEFWPIPYLMSNPMRTTAAEQQVEVSGVALVARDTGRVLFLQRALCEGDDNGGKWEFPGGHHEEGDTTSLHAGIREWEEEVGQRFPEGGEVINTWTSPDGIYRGHVVAIDEEAMLELHVDRVVDNPDEDGFEQAAWWAVEDARKNPALREECKKTPWDLLRVPALDKAAALEWLWEETPDGHR